MKKLWTEKNKNQSSKKKRKGSRQPLDEGHKPIFARSPPRSSDQKKATGNKKSMETKTKGPQGRTSKDKQTDDDGRNPLVQKVQTPPPLISDPNILKPSKTAKKHKQGGKKDDDSDNTLTDLPNEMPDIELERFEYRQQLILDEQLM
ncbi:hypothetical protein Q1695_015060 [Nippostrongylus brasiliensis]|nr:hypothetical protein Q1695_015060 [Nippostrongylus brasiliensis]